MYNSYKSFLTLLSPHILIVVIVFNSDVKYNESSVGCVRCNHIFLAVSMCMVDVAHRHVSDVPFRVVERGQVHPIVHVVQPRVRITFCSSHESAIIAVTCSVKRNKAIFAGAGWYVLTWYFTQAISGTCIISVYTCP